MSKTCPVCETVYPDSNAFCPLDGTTLRADEKSLDIVGTVIADRYLISSLLGEGGMGRVYLARHVRLPQQAAIKVLHPTMVSDAGAVSRFNREAANAARIEHDRVARVFDFGETSGGLVYLAMEYVPGKTLRDILRNESRLPPARAANIIYQVAEGLEAAHRIGIVHRDLKPDNIMVVTDENGVDRCKVVDFGIAKAVNSTQTQLTQTGMLVGTPEYMSPEQVLGESVDGRSDVYALALVAYNTFTGTLPFNSTTPERTLTARLIEDAPALSQVAPETNWPFGLQDALASALHRDPAERTGSALVFADSVVTAVEQWTGAAVLRPRTPMSTPAIVAAASHASLESGDSVSMSTMSATAQSASTPLNGPGQHTSIAGARSYRTTAILGAIGAIAAVVAVWFVLHSPKSSGQVAGGNVAATIQDAILDSTVSQPSTSGVFAASSAEGVASSGSNQSAADDDRSPVMREREVTLGGGRPGESDAPVGREQSLSSGVPAANTASASEPGRADRNGSVTRSRAEDLALARSEFNLLKTELLKVSAAPDEDQARSIAARLRAVLPRLDNGLDSTWTYIYLVQAQGIANDRAGACVPLRAANQMKSTDNQRAIIDQLIQSGIFTCTLR